MKIWDEMLRTAILGTERQAFNPPAVDGPLGDLLSELKADRPERALLDAVAAVALYRRAGRAPLEDRGPEPEIAAADDRPRASEAAAVRLRLMLGGSNRELTGEWLELAARAGRRVPEEMLPALLALGRAQTALRAAILPVIGRRGAWLAAQNEEWNYAAAGRDEADWERSWETGSGAARRALLPLVRASDAKRALALVTATWAEEKPEDRAAFIQALGIGLSADDEPFLEGALDDRRKEVRRAAAEVLAQLPSSGLCRRMSERVERLVAWREGRSAEIDVVLPANCDKAMIRDGIEPKPPPGKGERAWWLEQMIAATPLAHWRERWNRAPREVAEAAGRSEWRSALLAGWAGAIERQRSADAEAAEWGEAICREMMAHNEVADLTRLFAALPCERREALVMELLDAEPSLHPQRPSFRAVNSCRFAWSARMSERVLDLLARHAARDDYPQWHWAEMCGAIGRHFHPALSGEAAARLRATSESGNSLAPLTERFLEMLQFRSEMHEEMNA